jgi:glycyl-tRNA synthetase
VTYDFQTAEDQAVTVRDRDTMVQDRVAIDKLKQYFQDKLDM